MSRAKPPVEAAEPLLRSRRSVTSDDRERTWLLALQAGIFIACLVGMIIAFPNAQSPLTHTHWTIYFQGGGTPEGVDRGYTEIAIAKGDAPDEWQIDISLNASGIETEPAVESLGVAIYGLVSAASQDGVECADELTDDAGVGGTCELRSDENYSVARFKLDWQPDCNELATSNCFGYVTSLTLTSALPLFVSANESQVMALVPRWPGNGNIVLPVPAEAEYQSGPYPYGRWETGASFSLSDAATSGLFVGRIPQSQTNRDMRLLVAGALAGLGGGALIAAIDSALGLVSAALELWTLSALEK
ncbi:hypothetical protein [Microbacterium sp. No. 7]|uniref:hypothetical protein n=1 Tax=Microbacterium sp. No. 7 TaxID=1714373 RepID=UPI0006CF7AE1|nr:hypothetical protein [Microbacterium sp. No. 7]ALJ19614.1 hypothetical protein AOA12_06705 [Microbacterium sp. No. 7]